MAAIKLGADGCLLHDDRGSRRIPAAPVAHGLDTTAAGDACNAGFIANLIRGHTAEHAALCGHRIAGIVIQHRGAIAPKSAMASALLADPLAPATFAAHPAA